MHSEQNNNRSQRRSRPDRQSPKPLPLYPVSSNSTEIFAALEGIERERLQASIQSGQYGQESRAHDFRTVFFGSDAGKRVFAQIEAYCMAPGHDRDAESHGILAMLKGRRNVRDFILKSMTVLEEPKVQKEADE